MADNRDQIEQIRERLDIVNVVQRYVRLKKAGRNYVGLCPFHNEKTPSFSVNPELQIFKCFGCGRGGDIFAFVQDIEKIDFAETLERLASEAGIKLIKSQSSGRYKSIEEINDIARRYYVHQLKQPKNIKALKYLHGRGLKDSDIQKFNIGFAPGGDGLIGYLKKYTQEQLLSSGIFTKKDGKIREKFIMRVMFPIMSSRGKTIAFTGRILPDSKYGPKYMNSPETSIFSKKMGVYGIYESRQAIRGEDSCIVCEGTTDVISAHSIGIENIVAPLGTAFTEEQAQLISRMTKNILFLFDNDEAGQMALERAFEISSKMGLNAYAASPTPYKDLDELIQKDPKLAKSLAKSKTDAFSYLISSKTKDIDLNDYAAYTEILKFINKLLGSVNDASIKDFYIKKVLQITGIDLHSERKVTRETKAEEKNTKTKLGMEQYYLQILLSKDPIKFPEGHSHLDFTDNEVVSILKVIKEKSPENLKELNALLNEDESSLLVKLSVDPEAEDTDEINDVYRRIQKQNTQGSLKNLRTQLAAAEQMNNSDEIEKLLKKIQKETAKLGNLSR